MNVISKIKSRLTGAAPNSMERMALTDADIPSLAAEARSDLARLFYERRGQGRRLVHKWTHFLDAYDAHFAQYRDTDVNMLEIGVSMGGSLELWRDYFGPAANICGVDLNPDCARRFDPPNKVRIGSQDDPDFLHSVIAEIGQPDIVLDDGSHVGRHQVGSFAILFPLLKEGGLYVIEDLHTSYWTGSWEGGYRKPGTGIEFVKQIIDDMHAWYHDRAPETEAMQWVPAMHVYDSIVFIEKRRRVQPRHVKVQ
jgi:hypothetical protein